MHRGRLTGPFDAGAPPRFAVVAAPAGFGKSVLVDQWLRALGPVPSARVRLGPDDGERLPVRLASALAALGGRVEDVGRSVPAGSTRLAPPTAAAFAEAMADLGDTVLVVDTTHAGTDDGVADDVSLVVGALGPTTRVVLEQRGPWRSALGPAPDHVVGAAELAFTGEEVRELVARVSGRELADDEVAELVACTRGWPLAVRLAARRLGGGAGTRAVLRTIDGTERHISAYLGDEVLDRQEPRVRAFLLRTSVLEVLTPAGCAAVTGDPSAGEHLSLLARTGALVPSPGHGADAALHAPMLREFLHGELQVTEPAEALTLEARAASWWAGTGDLARAADHCIGAELWPSLLDLADGHGRTLFERGQARELLRWLDAVPTSSSAQRTQVGLRRAFAFNMLGESRRAAATLEALGDVPLGPAERILADAVRATWVFYDADRSSVAALADAALAAVEQVAPDDIPDLLGLTHHASLVTMLRGSRGRARWYLRDLDGARADLGHVASDTAAYPPWRVHGCGSLALLEAWEGDLGPAQELAELGLAIAGAHDLLDHPATLEVRAALANVHRERGELEPAARHLDDLLAVALRTRRPTSIAIHAIERAQWHLAAGRPDQGIATLEAERAVGEVAPPQRLQWRRLAVEVRLLLAAGQRSAARRLLARAAEGGDPPAELRAVAVQCALADGDADQARSLLDAWDDQGTGRRDGLERRLLGAALELACGDRRGAVEHARAVVQDAATDGHRRLFLDLGPVVSPVLRALLRVEPSGHLQSVLDGALPGAPSGRAASSLSDREVEVVRYLPTSLTNAEIAAQLFISLNTLKSHLASIYRKLGVADRRGAIAKAEELGLA